MRERKKCKYNSRTNGLKLQIHGQLQGNKKFKDNSRTARTSGHTVIFLDYYYNSFFDFSQCPIGCLIFMNIFVLHDAGLNFKQIHPLLLYTCTVKMQFVCNCITVKY